MAKNNIQHPLPTTEHHILGAGQKVIESVVAGFDALIIPPPTGDVVREVGENAVLVTNNSGAPIAVTGLVYKNGKGDEVLFPGSGSAAVGDGVALLMALPASFVLTEEDEGGGMFIRTTTGVSDITAVGAWTDVRGYERYTVDVTQAVTGLFPAIEEGDALRLARSLFESAPAAWLLNYDSVAHAGDQSAILTTLTDDGVTIPLVNSVQQPAVALPAGEAELLFTADKFTGNHSKGGNINIVSDTVATTKSPVVMVTVVRTNYSPVKTYQGGAY